jgi:hypothetical protein
LAAKIEPPSNIHILGGNNKPQRKVNSLAVFLIRQGNCIFSWLFSCTAKKKVGFLGSLSIPSSKRRINLVVFMNRQENMDLLGCCHRPPSKQNIPRLLTPK